MRCTPPIALPGPLALLLLALAALTACAAPNREAPRDGDGIRRGSVPALARSLPEGHAVLFHGGTLYPGRVLEDGSPLAPVEALLALDGVVLDLGSEDELAGRWRLEEVARVDLAGGVAVPGLQDAHGHIANLGALLEEVNLVGAESFEEVVARVAERAARVEPGAWILGRGWDHTRWPGAEFPSHDALSAAVPGHPVLLTRVDGHAALANRAAMEKAGLFDVVLEDPVEEGGRVHVDEGGRPTGLLIDTSIRRVRELVPGRTPEALERMVLRAQDELLSLGLTCVHDMGVGGDELELFQRLREEGRLRLRVAAYLWGNGLQGEAGLAGLPLEPDERDRFQAVGVKLMADGALGSRGAALLQAYRDAPDEQGLMRFNRAELLRLVRLCARFGLQPATHAIGDAANRMVLDVYDQVQEERDYFVELRPRIEHAQVLAPEDLPRLGQAGVIPSVQPTHATSDMRWAEDRLGPERVRGAYAWRDLRAPLAPLALGSDFPVESPNPLLGLHAAMTRQDASGAPAGGWFPEQRLSPAEALEGFTWGAAYAVGQERRRGRLVPGYACDLSVFDRDLLELGASDPAQLLEARCLMTVIDGQVEYDGRDG